MEQSQIGEARRVAQNLAATLGLADSVVGRAGIVATEAATNLVRHAKNGGWMLVQPSCDTQGVEIVAIDSGPGIPNLARCLEDGYSSGGTAGQGLGAIRRQSNTFEIHSETSKGTVLLSTVCDKEPNTASVEVGSVCVSKQGEAVCGDLWSMRRDAHGYTVLVADGLGHGIGAAEAARLAVEIFNKSTGCGPAECLDLIHSGLRATRGTAGAVARVEPSKKIIRFAGIGNIAASVLNGSGSRSLISYNGILGHSLYRLQELSYPWPAGGLLVMHSDGLSTHWDLDRYPGLRNRHPSLIAALLFRDFSRQRDDVTVVVAREVSS
jgi:anti-sigma regulatory factor (Ser/Thr protein kinase)